MTTTSSGTPTADAGGALARTCVSSGWLTLVAASPPTTTNAGEPNPVPVIVSGSPALRPVVGWTVAIAGGRSSTWTPAVRITRLPEPSRSSSGRIPRGAVELATTLTVIEGWPPSVDGMRPGTVTPVPGTFADTTAVMPGPPHVTRGSSPSAVTPSP